MISELKFSYTDVINMNPLSVVTQTYIYHQLSSGTDILLHQKAKMLRIIVCTRTSRVPFFWRGMGRPLVEKGKSTLIFGICLLPI